MLKNSDIVADLHTHTVFSKHAYSTLKENIDCARMNNLSCLAVTDHYYQPDDFFERKRNKNCGAIFELLYSRFSLFKRKARQKK